MARGLVGEGEGARRLYTNRGLLGDCCHFNGLDLVCKSSHPVTAVPLLPPQRFCSYLAFTPAMPGSCCAGVYGPRDGVAQPLCACARLQLGHSPAGSEQEKCVALPAHFRDRTPLPNTPPPGPPLLSPLAFMLSHSIYPLYFPQAVSSSGVGPGVAPVRHDHQQRQ